MKKTKLLIIFNLVIHSLFGQNYLQYYHLCNSADKEAYLKNYDSALKKLETAFASVDYVHAFQYEKASTYAALNNDYEKAYSFAKASILNGNRKPFWKEKVFRKFRKSEHYTMLMDSVEVLQKQALLSINWAYKAKIDSLHFVDQRIIRNNKSTKGDYNIDQSKLPENLFDLDSTNLITLLELIKIHGFPSEQNIGVEGYRKASGIIHHNFRLEKNEKHHPLIIQALYSGEYLPNHFIGMYEQYNMWYKDQTFFTTWDKNLSKSNLGRINANRIKYGLKDLSAFKITRKGLGMKPIW